MTLTASLIEAPSTENTMDPIYVEANYFRVNLFNGICIAYVDSKIDALPMMSSQETIVLIHGFPQTSYQYRHVIPLLTNSGYRVIAPDYRGAGESSKPMDGFTKASMAADFISLLDHLQIIERVHVVGHDMGGIVAFVLASRWPERIASVCVSECLLPGTDTFNQRLSQSPTEYFHFAFHSVYNLPEALIQGRERLYIDYFINKMCYRIGAFGPEHIQRYTNAYCQPGALRCALDLYRSLEKDAEDTRSWLEDNGKCQVPCMMMCGEFSSYGEYIGRMGSELVEKDYLTQSYDSSSGHFVAEENPREFVELILAFIQRQDRSRSRSRSPAQIKIEGRH